MASWNTEITILVGVEQVGVPLAESSYFATFAESSCCVALSASVLALLAKKIQKVTIKFALFQQVQFFSADTSADVSATLAADLQKEC